MLFKWTASPGNAKIESHTIRKQSSDSRNHNGWTPVPSRNLIKTEKKSYFLITFTLPKGRESEGRAAGRRAI